jgi:hypothetical protein
VDSESCQVSVVLGQCCVESVWYRLGEVSGSDTSQRVERRVVSSHVESGPEGLVLVWCQRA